MSLLWPAHEKHPPARFIPFDSALCLCRSDGHLSRFETNVLDLQFELCHLNTLSYPSFTLTTPAFFKYLKIGFNLNDLGLSAEFILAPGDFVTGFHVT